MTHAKNLIASRLWKVIALAVFIQGVAIAADADEKSTLPMEVQVFSDPSAKYWILDIDILSSGLIHATNRREGRSGKSFAIREINCETREFRYLADADTYAGLKDSKPSPHMAPLSRGSISDVISKAACDYVKKNLESQQNI